MIHAEIRMTVADYNRWRPAFDSYEPNRRAAGATGDKSVYRDLSNPNDVTMVLEWDNQEHAETFFRNPEVIQYMRNAGVQGTPQRRFLSCA